jgi:hypothetical protein
MYTRGLGGLGIVVTMTPKFDPTKIKVRLTHYIDVAANAMADQARNEIKSAGMRPDEGGREEFRQRAINLGLSNIVSWSTTVPMPKTKSAAATYGMMAAQLVIGIVFPWVGLGLAVSKLFGKKKKMAMPWNAIYAAAVPYAQQMTQAEELERIAKETREIEVQRTTALETRSAEAAKFKLPEGITSISRGALVMAVKGKPIEVRK